MSEMFYAFFPPSERVMELLKSLRTRDGDDDDEGHGKKKRSIPIEVDEEDEGMQFSKRVKTTNLGLNLQDDYFEVETIKKRPLPREDGRQWSFIEQTAVEEAKRPYGKQYLQEQSERQKLLSHNKDYRFANELAGALRKELSDIIDPEDMVRMAQERERERVETEIELKRTRVDMDQKYELVQKLKTMLTEETTRQKSVADRQAPYDLRMSSKYLVDGTLLPIGVAPRHNDFLDFLKLYDTYAGTEEARLREREKIVLEVLPVENQGTGERSEAWLNLFFYVYVYYRDFMSNETGYSLVESLLQKLSYVLEQIGSPESTIKKESSSTSTTTDVEENQFDELGLRGDTNPLRKLREFQEISSPVDLIDWPLYKKRRTETIDMNYFDKMGISVGLERKMVALGINERYMDNYPSYARKVLTYLYGTEQERRDVTAGLDGLNLTESMEDDIGGNPPDINALIQIQFPAYKTDKRLDAIERLLRSHFLCLFFEEVPWADITTLLMPEQTTIVNNITGVVITELKPIMSTMLQLYKTILLQYMAEIARFMAPVIQLTPRMAALLSQPILFTAYDGALASSVDRFDALNALFGNVLVRDLIKDDLFYEYLYTGSKVFINQQFGGDGGGGGVGQPVNLAIEEEEYPILVLHRVFRAYMAYIDEYSNMMANNITRLTAAIEKANKKIAEVVGDESYVLNAGVEYRQRKSFTTLPENSGFIKMRAEIVYLLRQAYHLVMDHCPALRNLPLEGFQGDSAYETGLSTDFIGVVAVLAADREFSFPDGYRSGKQFTKMKQDKQGMMMRMRRYCWQGGNGRPYVIIKDRDGDIGLRPFYAGAIGGRIMF